MTATPGPGGGPLPPSPGPARPGVVSHVPGQVPLLEALATCVHPDGTHHLAGYDRDGYAITCDQWRVYGGRLRWWVVAPESADDGGL